MKRDSYDATESSAVVADLLRVGWDKPLGYQSIDLLSRTTIPMDDLRKRLRDAQVETYELTEDECGVLGGAVYAYHRAALWRLLHHQHDDGLTPQEVLRGSMWPPKVGGFVLAVATVSVGQADLPELYLLIGRAFADKRFSPAFAHPLMLPK